MRIICRASLTMVATGIVVLSCATGAQAANGATVRCKGSLDNGGKRRADKKGIVRDYYTRHASCPAARKLFRPLNNNDDLDLDKARRGTFVTTVVVPGGSAWKCRLFFRQDGRSTPFFKLNPEKAKTVVEGVSCRALTGRRNRRITFRSANLRNQLVDDEGESSS